MFPLLKISKEKKIKKKCTYNAKLNKYSFPDNYGIRTDDLFFAKTENLHFKLSIMLTTIPHGFAVGILANAPQ